MRTFRPLFLILTLFVCLRTAEAQAVRFDQISSTTSAQCSPGKQCPLNVLPGTQVNICGGTVTTLASCLASPATTYTDASAGTPCVTTAQLTPQTGGACLATADNQGGYGFWISPGSYSYFLRVPVTAGGGTYGPYPITLGASAGTPAGATVDANYATLALGCSAAGSGTLYVTRAWNSVPTQTLACGLNFLGNGKIQAGASQTVTVTGSITAPSNQQILDSTTNSGALFVLSTKVAWIFPNWFGAKMDGSTDDTAAWQASLASCPASGCQIQIPQNATSATSTGIIVSNINQSQYIRIVGAGDSSKIQCTGVRCVSWTGVFAQDSGMENMMISDPVGNSATVGLYVNGGGSCCAQSNLRFSNMRIFGNSSNQLGTGVSLTNTILPIFDSFRESYFFNGMVSSSSNIWAVNFELNVNAHDGWECSTADGYLVNSDIEANNNYGIVSNACNPHITSTRFEGNLIGDWHNTGGGTITSVSNFYVGGNGPVLNDSGSFVQSTNDAWIANITNNSLGNSSTSPGFVMTAQEGTPTISGSGWTVMNTGSKSSQVGNPGVSYVFTGAPSYTFDQMISSTKGFNDNGNAFTVTNVVCGGGITVSSNSKATRGIIISGTATPCAFDVTLPVAIDAWNCTMTDFNTGSAYGNIGRGTTHASFSVNTTGQQFNITCFPF